VAVENRCVDAMLAEGKRTTGAARRAISARLVATGVYAAALALVVVGRILARICERGEGVQLTFRLAAGVFETS
jgi:hypothetical protein